MLRPAAVLALLPLLAAACTTVDQYRSRRAPDAPVITVLVPGYRGSFLYEGERRAYLNIGDAFSRGDFPLGSCANGRAPLEPGGPMTKFVIFPYVNDVYAGLMEWGRDTWPGFTAFGYDWRQDLTQTAKELCDFIGPRRARIIAHSMGGVVTMLASAQCGDQLEAVAFAGVPFRGSPGAFDDLFLGTPTVRNTTLLSPEALWTFSSTWQLLPRTDDFFAGPSGEQVTVPISDPATWRTWTQACPALLEHRLADRAKLPVTFEAPAGARALAIIGRGRPSVSAMRRQGDFFDFAAPPREDGDGTVTAANAAPPFTHEAVLTDFEHQTLLNDPAVREAIAAFFARSAQP